jgi:branched-chain amino acid transport system ATP-binding protein
MLAEPVTTSTAALDVRNVSVTFGGLSALNEVSVRVARGSITGLIGPNGAGKTTLFNVISGLERPRRGSVHLNGTEMTGLGPHRRARLGLGRTFQRLELFSTLSALDNVLVGVEATGKGAGERRGRHAARSGVARELLEQVGAGAIADQPVGALSTGTARLVELARALATGPTVLLLDEPSSGLDDNETRVLGDALTEIARTSVAVLLVEHDMELVQGVCDHVYVLDFGEIIAAGPPTVLEESDAVRAAYLGTLARKEHP